MQDPVVEVGLFGAVRFDTAIPASLQHSTPTSAG